MYSKQIEDETPGNLSPLEMRFKEVTTEIPDETTEHLRQERGNDLFERSPINENTTSEDSEVKKKKKKKKKRRQNKTAPMEGDNNYELPPLNAWDTPPGTLNGFPGSGNGFPGSGGISPRGKLEPLGLPRLPGIVTDGD